MKEGANRQILLVEKPAGKLGPEHFRLVESPSEAERRRSPLARALHIVGRRQPRLDARSDLSSGRRANAVMAGGSVAEVIESKAPGFAPGDLVFSDTGWQDYAVLPAKQLVKVPPWSR